MSDEAMGEQRVGKEPDYRFSLANERTFLAWIRTALALLAGGMLLYQSFYSLRLTKSVTIPDGILA